MSNEHASLGTLDYYMPFLRRIAFEVLDCFPRMETTIWHYTSWQNLVPIVESGTLYSTHVSCLNDSTELLYAIGGFREALESLLPEFEMNARVGSFLKRYIRLMTNDPLAASEITAGYYVTCFTELEDNLGQWRSYGGGESGVSLGFKPSSLMLGVPNSMLARVDYDVQRHQEAAKAVARATIDAYQEGLGEGGENWDDAFLKVWDEVIMSLAPLVKDPGFAGEGEVRLVCAFQPSDLPNLELLPRRTMLSRHLPITFPQGGAIGPRPLLPLSALMIGPGRHKETSRLSAEFYLQSRGYFSDLTASSKRPYQEI